MLTSALLALGALVRPAVAQTPPATGALNPGDAIRITVWRKPELSGDLQIAADGSIKHPLYREVHVGGLPMARVDDVLREFLGHYENNPQFLVEPLYRVAVIGEVRKPDMYTLPVETTMGQAIAMAGGVTERGRMSHISLIRDGREEVLDLSRPESGAAGRTLRSGDQLVVGRSHNPLRDVIAPLASIMGAIAMLTTAIAR